MYSFPIMNRKGDELKIKEELVKLAKVVKDKYTSLKKSEDEEKYILDKTFKPVTKSLDQLRLPHKSNYENDIIMQNSDDSEGTEIKEEVLSEDDDFQSISDADSIKSVSAGDSIKSVPTVGEEEISVKSDKTDAISNDIREYLDNNIGRELDKVYGIRYNKNGETHIGKSKVTFENNYVYVKKTRFPITQGLLELLFMKEPDEYKRHDLKSYIKILQLSDKLKPHHNSRKYKNIIQKFVKSPNLGVLTHKRGIFQELEKSPKLGALGKQGKGNWLNTKQLRVEFYENADELVHTLKKLISSKLAGNTGLSNEIQAIIEELRELDIIF